MLLHTNITRPLCSTTPLTGPVLGASPHGVLHSPSSCDGGMIPPITQHMTGRRKVRSGTLRTVCPSSYGLGGTIETDSYRNSPKLEMFLPPGIPSAGCSCNPPHLFKPVLRKGWGTMISLFLSAYLSTRSPGWPHTH